jgi:uncharacterized protein YheU (UPF0270 family)
MYPDAEPPQDPVDIPHTELSSDVLQRVIESFVLREGTDYGIQEVSLEGKVTQVLRQLERGEAQIVFDPNTETIDIVVAKKSAFRQGERT